jgi:N,N'-diacetylchitobiose transport system permease protein
VNFHLLRRRSGKVALNAAGVVVAIVTLLPILLMLSTSFKPSGEILTLTPHLLPSHPTLSNYSAVLSGSAAGMSYWTFLRNSLFVTLTSVIVSSLIAMLAAIGVARFKFRFRTTYLLMLLIVQMLPQQALVIALYLDFRAVNLLDSLIGLTILYTAFALPVTIFMLRNFVAAVPRQLEEAAAIDGAGPVRIFWNVLLPLVAPGMVTTSVFAFISAWNEFIFALTFLGTDEPKYTLPLFVGFFQGQHSTAWGPVMASSALFTIPVMIFFLIVQRRLRDGMVAGAVKG